MKIDYLKLLQSLGPFPSIQQTADFLGCYYNDVYQLASKGELEAIRPGKKWRIVLNSLAEYISHRVDSIPVRRLRLNHDASLAQLVNHE